MSPELLEAIYETSLEPARWREVLEGIGRSVNSNGGQILLWDDRDSGAPFSMYVSDCTSPDADRLYALRYGAIDPRRRHAMTMPIGGWLACHHVCDDRFVQSSEFYQDFLIPTVGCRYMAGVRLSDDDGMHAMLAIGRSAGSDSMPYDDEALRKLQQFTPHLLRAAQMQARIRRLQGELAIRDATLDRLSMAVAVVDRDRLLRHANAAGEMLLQNPAGPISCRSGRLGCHSLRESEWFAAAVKAAVDERKGDATVLGVGSRAQCNCVVIPLSPRLSFAAPWQRPMALLVFTDSSPGDPVDSRTLQALFGLTPAEALVAAGLAAGQTLEAFATSRGISIMTARAQLRAVFEKMNLGRQADLVSILQRLAQVRAPDDGRTGRPGG